MYKNVDSRVSVDSVIPPQFEEPAGTSYDCPRPSGYDTPRDTINPEIVNGVNAVRRASSMQAPHQLLLPPHTAPHSWPIGTPKSPTIVISAPSEEQLACRALSPSPPLPISSHRRSCASAIALAAAVAIAVVLLIVLFVHFQ